MMRRSFVSRTVRWLRERPVVLRIASRSAAVLLTWLYRSLRVVHVSPGLLEDCVGRGERVIVAFWHGRLLMMPFLYPDRPRAILISEHLDGEYISRVATILGSRVIRGSTTRGGIRAFRQMIGALREGVHLVITPDGPKGPPRRVKTGIIELARLTGAPIVPVSFSSAWRRFLKSWDTFLVPLPFSRAVYVWGEPIYISQPTTKKESAKYQELLAARLDLLTMEADAYFRARG